MMSLKQFARFSGLPSSWLRPRLHRMPGIKKVETSEGTKWLIDTNLIDLRKLQEEYRKP